VSAGHLLKRTAEELKVEEGSEFWGDVLAVGASPVAITAGFAKGAFDAATGNGPFTDGFNATANPIVRGAKKFGHEHGPAITKGLLGGAATALGARILNETLRHLKR
jgi:hypothetical protein